MAAPDVLGAHARLAALDPGEPGDLLQHVLLALLIGSGAPAGILVDPHDPAHPVVAGAAPGAEALARAAALLVDTPEAALPADAAGAAFDGAIPAGTELVSRSIPLTAGDETLAIAVFPLPLADPVGFASVTAHAASLLASIRMSAKVREADFELKYRVWELESLYDVGLSIAGTLDLGSLAEEVLMKSISLLNARVGTLIVRDISGEDGVLTRDFGGTLLTAEEALSLPDEILVANTRAERVGALIGAPAEKLMAVPIRSDGKRLGVLVVADKESRGGAIEDFNDNDKRILSLFGNQAAIALENARLHRDAIEKEKMEREIELAASIQKTILPVTLPQSPGLVLAGGNLPTLRVGGDYFDVFPLPDGRVAFCVADVAGKGVPAALLVSTVHACLHLLVEYSIGNLPALTARINKHLVRFSSTRKFVTLFLALYDPATRVLRYVNAGHNPGLVLSGPDVRLLPSGGVPIGMLPNVVHKEDAITLAENDLVVLYSDGITEALSASDEEFGMERLTELLTSHREETPDELTGRIFASVAEFTRGVAQYDDQTVLIARVA